MLLALETSTKHLSVALFDSDKLLEEIGLPPDGVGHSEKLLPVVDRLLKAHQTGFEHIDKIALASGPGSFTSLRVGMATALGLSAGRIPLVSVSSLKALCFALNQDGDMAPVFLAGRGRIYAAAYQKKGAHLKALIDEGSFEISDFVLRLGSLKKEVFVFGPGADANKNDFIHLMEGIVPNASSVGKLVLKGEGNLLDLNAPRLNYLQAPDFGHKKQGNPS